MRNLNQNTSTAAPAIPVTTSPAKTYLSQAYRIDQRINAKLEQVAHLRSLVERVTASFGHDRVQRSRNVSPMENAVIKIMEAEQAVDEQIDQQIATKVNIALLISEVADADYRLVLELRYLSMKSWESIAADMHFSLRWVHIVHERALVTVERALAAQAGFQEKCAR